jgi:hypothetical protein
MHFTRYIIGILRRFAHQNDIKGTSLNVILSGAKDPNDDTLEVHESQGFVAPISAQNDKKSIEVNEVLIKAILQVLLQLTSSRIIFAPFNRNVIPTGFSLPHCRTSWVMFAIPRW